MTSLIATLLAFVSVILIVNRTNTTWTAMMVGSLVAALGAGLSIEAAINIAVGVLNNFSTLALIVTVVLIKSLGNIMEKAGLIQKMVYSLQAAIKNPSIIVAAIPIILGLLPIPGGAYMSAPLIEKAGNRIQLPAENLVAANIIFRHIVYFVFPLYPTLILLQSFTNISVYKVIVFCLVPMLVSAGLGFLYILPQSSHAPDRERASSLNDWKEFFRASLPITILVSLAIITNSFLFAAAFAFIVTLLLTQRLSTISIEENLIHTLKELDWKLALTVLGILFFQKYIEAAGALTYIAGILAGQGVPINALLLIVSFITGLLTGSTLGAVGIVLSIFVPLFSNHANLVVVVSLAYIYTMTGYIVSPLHLCLILTQEYFKGNLKRVYHLMAVPLISLLITSLILGLLLGF